MCKLCVVNLREDITATVVNAIEEIAMLFQLNCKGPYVGSQPSG